VASGQPGAIPSRAPATDTDTVWLRMTGSGTKDGPYMGSEPTGRSMRTPVFDSLRVENGKIVEHWGFPDRLYAMIQLGLVEAPAPRGRL